MRLLTAGEKKAPLQGRHKDEEIYIVGCGNSLNEYNSKVLEDGNHITIGVNKSFHMLKTTYHLHVDYKKHNTSNQFSVLYDKYLKAMIDEGSYLFAPLNHQKEKTAGNATHHFYSDPAVGFAVSDDDPEVLRLGASSTSIYQALQLAVIMGAKLIYLIGVDFNHIPIREGYAKMHAYEHQNKLLPRDLVALEDRRLKFERYIENKALPKLNELGVSVVNISADSNLTAFEKLP